MRMPTDEMLDEMLDQAVKRIQNSNQHSKTKFVFDLDQTSSNINLQMFNISNMGGQTHPTFHPILVFSMLEELFDAIDQAFT